MKTQTALILQSHQKQGNLQFLITENGIELDHKLTEQEISDLVTAEYGETTQDKNELFLAIMKKMVRIALDKAKNV